MKWVDVYGIDSENFEDTYDHKHCVNRKGSEAEKQVEGYYMVDDHFGKEKEGSAHDNPIHTSHSNTVVDKDGENAKVRNGSERMREDLRCKQWRCRLQALMGYNLCEHHMVQAGNKAQLVSVKRKGFNAREIEREREKIKSN